MHLLIFSLILFTAYPAYAGRLIIDGVCSNECLGYFAEKSTCVTKTARIFLYSKHQSKYFIEEIKPKLERSRPDLSKEISESDIVIEYYGTAFADKFNVPLCKG